MLRVGDVGRARSDRPGRAPTATLHIAAAVIPALPTFATPALPIVIPAQAGMVGEAIGVLVGGW